jgi:hypothetical protein
MNENQILTAITALATLSILFANWRIADLRSSLEKRMDDFQVSVRRELELTRETVKTELQLTRETLRAEAAKNHSELLTLIARIEQKLEGQLHA